MKKDKSGGGSDDEDTDFIDYFNDDEDDDDSEDEDLDDVSNVIMWLIYFNQLPWCNGIVLFILKKALLNLVQNENVGTYSYLCIWNLYWL